MPLSKSSINSGWRRDMTPVDRLRADAERYADAVIYSLGSEYATLSDVHDARSVSVMRISRILRRSSADGLAPMVLAYMVRAGLIRIDGSVVHFLPTLIARWEDEEARADEAAQGDAAAGKPDGGIGGGSNRA